jgi:hypothetical protein
MRLLCVQTPYKKLFRQISVQRRSGSRVDFKTKTHWKWGEQKHGSHFWIGKTLIDYWTELNWFMYFQTPEEWKATMASGHTPGPAPKGRRGVGNPILRKRQTLPSSWDWRTQGYVSPVQNQVKQSYAILRSYVHVTLVRELTMFSNVIVRLGSIFITETCNISKEQSDLD